MTASFSRATFHLSFVEKVAEKGAVPQLGSLLFSPANFWLVYTGCKFACKFAANLLQICKCTSTIKRRAHVEYYSEYFSADSACPAGTEIFRIIGQNKFEIGTSLSPE